MQDVVIDTNVLVAALRSRRGASYQLVRLIGQGFWRVNISVALALEYEDVLKRENMLVGVSKTDVDDLLDYLFKSSELRRSVLRCGRVCEMRTTSVFWNWRFTAER